jgi:hypothetical protein
MFYKLQNGTRDEQITSSQLAVWRNGGSNPAEKGSS